MKYNKYVFYVLAFLQGLVFYSAVAMLYRLDNGLTPSQVGVIEGIHTILMVLLEIPWGYLGDRMGYKKTLLLCNFLFFISKLIFWQADSFFDFLLERLLLSVVISGLSGCDIALLYISIKPNERSQVFGIYHMMEALGCVVAGLGYSLFFVNRYKDAAFATAIAYFLALLITFVLKEQRKKRETTSLRKVYKEFMKQKHMLLLLIASALFMETLHTITAFYAQLQYERVHIAPQYFGILYIMLQLFGMSSGWSGRLIERMGKKALMLLLFTLAGLGCVMLMINSAILSILALALLVICNSVYYPLLQIYENECMQTVMRASMLSFYAAVMNGISAILPTCFGWTSNFSLCLMYALALLFVGIALCLFLCWQRVSETNR